MKNPPSGSVGSSKHRISKRQYKVVLSKTYVGAILLMHMYQGKGRWGSIAEVPALTWLVHNFYLTANSITMETPIWARVHIVNPADLPMWSQKMCAGSQAGLNSRSSTLQTVPQTSQNSELLRLLEKRRGELVG